MVLQTLRNLSARAIHVRRRDFIDMGLGIEARAKRCRKYWAPHLELTKNFQKSAINQLSEGGAIAILGAGSLLDIAIEEVLKRFDRVELYDANPLVEKRWSELQLLRPKQDLKRHIKDLTNSIDHWTELLKAHLNSRPTPTESVLRDFLSNLKTPGIPEIGGSFDVVFSINLLSQIPIYWRDRVHDLVYRKLGIDTDEMGLYQSDLQAALENSMRQLQQDHLVMLNNSGAKLVVLITDTEFFYYEREISPWQCESAIYFEDPLALAGYELATRDTWLWHIIPQGVEAPEYGSFHKVVALAFNGPEV